MDMVIGKLLEMVLVSHHWNTRIHSIHKTSRSNIQNTQLCACTEGGGGGNQHKQVMLNPSNKTHEIGSIINNRTEF